MLWILLLISWAASAAGAVCGIGGGVIIKPVLDVFQLGGPALISFLSSCTVLSMTVYSVGRSLAGRERAIDLKLGTPLALGSAAGGAAGKELFHLLEVIYQRPGMLQSVQSAVLAVLTIGTLIYIWNKDRIKAKKMDSFLHCILVGLALGVISSFLGIGGGPVNLVVLHYFFSMDTKTAAQNSLYIILFSQITSLITVLISGLPEFQGNMLLVMTVGGILGGICGRQINKRISARAVDRLFMMLMLVIVLISVYNTCLYNRI